MILVNSSVTFPFPKKKKKKKKSIFHFFAFLCHIPLHDASHPKGHRMMNIYVLYTQATFQYCYKVWVERDKPQLPRHSSHLMFSIQAPFCYFPDYW